MPKAGPAGGVDRYGPVSGDDDGRGAGGALAFATGGYRRAVFAGGRSVERVPLTGSNAGTAIDRGRDFGPAISGERTASALATVPIHRERAWADGASDSGDPDGRPAHVRRSVRCGAAAGGGDFHGRPELRDVPDRPGADGTRGKWPVCNHQ